jgi:hypothetical protein
VPPSSRALRQCGSRKCDGLISPGGFRYRVPIVLAGEAVEAVAADHLVRIFQRDVLVAEYVQHRPPNCDWQIPRVHPIRHNRAKEHGGVATPNGRPATDRMRRPSLDPDPLTGRS